MAHFFDAVSYAPLVTCPIQTGEKKTVGLFGGDFFGNDLGVFIDQSVVKIQEKKRGQNLRYFELTALKTGQAVLHAYAGLYDYALPIPVNVTKKRSTPQGKQTERKGIIDEALTHVGKAHYLWGTAGNTPGKSDGAKYKPAVAKMLTDSFTLTEPYIQTAFTDIGGRNTCAGSCDKHTPQPSVQEVSTYLVAGLSVLQNNLTPRTYKFNGTLQSNGTAHNGIVWGESCTSRKHFDCIGFVSYCVDKFWKGTIPFGTEIKNLMNTPGTYGCVEISDKDDVLNGDIVGQFTQKGGWHHIGLVYLSGNAVKVVQAADSPQGVTDGEVFNAASPSAWTKRVRVADNYL